MSKPTLMGLTGLATSGKDTVGALLRMVGYQRLAFADGVRREVHEWMSDQGKFGPRYYPPGVKVSSALGLGADQVYAKPTYPPMRALLQEWGMARREQDPAYWIKRLLVQIPASSGMANALIPPCVITDVRFQNEVEFVEGCGGQIWNVFRPGTQQLAHESELLQAIPDVTIQNSGDLQHLASEVLRALEASEK